MQRMIARPQFTGAVTRGARYVLVDDVTTMGGTFAELAHHIRQGGGEVVGIVALTNAARNEKLTPSPARIRLLEERFGDAIREIFGVEPSALTAPEAGYLSNFRDADDLRARAARAEEHRNRRLATKGLSQPQDPKVADQSGPAQESSAPSPPSSTPTDPGSPQRETPDAEVAVATPRRVPRASLKQLTDLERQGREVADAFLAAVDHAASKPLPTRPRIPVAPILGGPPKTLANIVIDVQQGTGKKLTTGKPGRGFAGVYKPGSSSTIVRYSGDLDTTAHELAHALDDEYGIVKGYAGQPTSPFDAELKPFAEHGSVQPTGPRASASYWRGFHGSDAVAPLMKTTGQNNGVRSCLVHLCGAALLLAETIPAAARIDDGKRSLTCDRQEVMVSRDQQVGIPIDRRRQHPPVIRIANGKR